MAFVPSRRLLIALRSFNESIVCTRCTSNISNNTIYPTKSNHAQRRSLQTTTTPRKPTFVPLRKELKEEAKARKLAGQPKCDASSSKSSSRTSKDPRLEKWELTVGIEIHAELNTARKLFSQASTSLNDTPNSHVSVFDAALPGAQPQFQRETLLPALRAAIALRCEIQKTSSWDRKHYFWWDQPNGYQITQYYHPFALNGSITLYPHDDIDPADHPSLTIGIKQIQMEQDTAKTVLQPPSTHLLDFNRVSHPLIEIITLPQLHNPKTAAALVRKIQSILKAVNASTTGMEMGGLRADVNVSVKRRDGSGVVDGGKGLEYGGVTGLGQRTEIKNLSSFKAVEDAIVAERDRQIAVLEGGGVVMGETRGWTLGSSETRRLRGKEGEVDYRYMPDPDLGAIVIDDDLLSHLRSTLPPLPDETLNLLTNDLTYGLTMKDAKTLLALDDGDRVDYYLDVVELVLAALPDDDPARSKVGRVAANWILHDLPTILPPPLTAPPPTTSAPLATLLYHLLTSQITLPTAKSLLPRIFLPHTPASPSPISPPPTPIQELDITHLITSQNLRLIPLSDSDYHSLARTALQSNPEMARKAAAEMGNVGGGGGGAKKGAKGKIMWFVGAMVRQGEEGRVQPERAEKAVWEALGGWV